MSDWAVASPPQASGEGPVNESVGQPGPAAKPSFWDQIVNTGKALGNDIGQGVSETAGAIGRGARAVGDYIGNPLEKARENMLAIRGTPAVTGAENVPVVGQAARAADLILGGPGAPALSTKAQKPLAPWAASNVDPKLLEQAQAASLTADVPSAGAGNPQGTSINDEAAGYEAPPNMGAPDVPSPDLKETLAGLANTPTASLGGPKGALGGLLYVLQGAGAGLGGHPEQALGYQLAQKRQEMAQNLVNQAYQYKYGGQLQQQGQQFQADLMTKVQNPQQFQMLMQNWRNLMKTYPAQVQAQAWFKALQIKNLTQAFVDAGLPPAAAAAVANSQIAGAGAQGEPNFGNPVTQPQVAGAAQ